MTGAPRVLYVAGVGAIPRLPDELPDVALVPLGVDVGRSIIEQLPDVDHLDVAVVVVQVDERCSRFHGLVTAIVESVRQRPVVVVVPGIVGPADVEGAVRAGAVDIVVADDPRHLGVTLIREAARAREAFDREARLIAMFGNHLDAVAFVDDDARVVQGNPALAVLLGVPRDRLVSDVLDNVLRNALKHTPAGTQIWIRTRTPASIIIEDDGPGVPAHLHERVFEPFQQGPDQLDRHAPGTGIGLSLSQRVVRLHRGEITLSDRPGGGARFVVDLSEASG